MATNISSPYREQTLIDPNQSTAKCPSYIRQLKRIIQLNRFSHPKLHQDQHYRKKIGGRWLFTKNPQDKRIMWQNLGPGLDFSLLLFQLDDYKILRQHGFWVPDIIWRDDYEEIDDQKDKKIIVEFRDYVPTASMPGISVGIEFVRFGKNFNVMKHVLNDLGGPCETDKILTKHSTFWWEPHYAIKSSR